MVNTKHERKILDIITERTFIALNSTNFVTLLPVRRKYDFFRYLIFNSDISEQYLEFNN